MLTKEKRLVLLKRDVVLFALDHYEVNRTGARMAWLAQRFARRYQGLVGQEQSEIEPLAKFIEGIALLMKFRGKNGALCFLPKNVVQMYFSYLSLDANDERLRGVKLWEIDDIALGKREGPPLTEKTKNNTFNAVDEMVVSV
jgi:hypothetical protein